MALISSGERTGASARQASSNSPHDALAEAACTMETFHHLMNGGRRFHNDAERPEELFDLYTKMTAHAPKPKKGKKAA